MLFSTADARRNLFHQWRRQIGQRTRLAQSRGPRPFAVVSYLCRDEYLRRDPVDLNRLTLVALFDEQLSDGRLATRLVGVGGKVGATGIEFGRPTLTKFDKDVRLAPGPGGSGPRLDAEDEVLLSFALRLEQFLERCARHPFMPRRRVPRLPVLPAGVNAACMPVIDPTTLPKRQIIALDSPVRDLVGRYGTTTYDFFNTRFRVAR